VSQDDGVTQTTVADQPVEIDRKGLTCPHCKTSYSAEETNRLTSHKMATGLLRCEKCLGYFEWVRATQVFYSTKAIWKKH
jgi:hypothetical protein